VSGTPVVVPATPVVPAGVSAGGWRWPTQGQLIGRFAAEDPKRQGIGIAGTAGQPVVAAADGVVVYSGAGLVGYGELIIVKHSDEWLSAYAHNRRRLVAEGAAVKAGEQIAELGRSGTSRDMLHFEIRRNGKPVDPLTILPRP
jgi:lipoprotein NlpD